MLFTVLLAHVVVGAGLLLGARWLRGNAFLLGALPMVGGLGVLAAKWSDLLDGAVHTESVTWVGGLALQIDARLDGFAALMILLVTGIGVAVMLYARSYFSSDAAAARIAGLLVLFAGSMLGLVVADHLIWLYACWELTSITSYLLIGREQKSAKQRTAALQALLVTGAGGLAMLAGFVILAQQADTWSLRALLDSPPGGTTAGVGLGLVLAGVFTKSAQVPFHFWLPGAMVAPTPISAYLHSATMVKAGIYLLARFAPAFAAMGVWRPVVIGVGLATMVLGALRALRQDDLKILLAHGTVSQLGLMTVLAGAGTKDTVKAICLLLVAHGLFKGALFLVVGAVDHQTGTRLRSELRLGQGWTTVRVVAIVSAASMAGVPPLAGFIAKEFAYKAFVDGTVYDRITLAGAIGGSVLTFAYSARFLTPFLPARTPGEVASDATGDGPPPRPAFFAPAVALAVGTLAAGVAAGPVLGDLIEVAANALDPKVGDPKVALWTGFNAALYLSIATLAMGALLVWLAMHVERLQARLAPSIRADDVFARLLAGMNATARRVTATVQPGSLPLSIGIILLVVVGAPTISLLITGGVRWDGPVAGVAAHWPLAAVLVLAALGVASVRRRFAAVLLLGAVGFTMALVFMVQGAPDLALTQFAIETLSVVVFVLVIRHLPEDFRPSRLSGGVALRAGVSVVVAAGVFLLAMATSGGIDERATSEQVIAAAEPEGGGQNVVNVILVDVRGLDTLGEVTVLAVAAVGVVALARVGRGRSRARREIDDGEAVQA